MMAGPQNPRPSGAFDLIIVGASFAGLVAARTAAHRGLSVAVLDAKSEPGARVRTTGILVKEAVDETDIPAALTRRIAGARLYAPGGARVSLTTPGYYFLSTDTRGVLRWLAREASRAGATLYFGARFTGASLVDDEIRLHGLGLRARYLLGADGAKSEVAKCFGLGMNREFLVGVEREYASLPDLDEDYLHCFIDSRLAPGYLGWLAPGVGMTQVGLAVAASPFGDARKPDISAFLARIASEFRFDSRREVERRSGLIPCGGRVSPLSTRRVLLTGDAAGLVSPLTAGGIRLAFQYGRRAALSIADYLYADGEDPGRAMARVYPRFPLKTLMRKMWSIAPPNALIDATVFTPPMRALARWMMFHRRGGAYALADDGARIIRLHSDDRAA